MATSEPDADRRGEAAWRLIEPHLDAISIYDGPLRFLQDFAQVPEAPRHMYAVWWCDSEVCNGGFHQFFLNSTGVLAPEAREGFRAMGLMEFADLLDAAIGRFGEQYPRDRDARRAGLQAMRLPGEKRQQWDPLYELDDCYYAAKQASRFYEHLDEFARRHAP